MSEKEPKSGEWSERPSTILQLKNALKKIPEGYEDEKEIIEKFIANEENGDPEEPIKIKDLIDSIKGIEDSEPVLQILKKYVYSIEKYLDLRENKKKAKKTSDLTIYEDLLKEFTQDNA